MKKSDFDELKAIVHELAVAQQRTEMRVEELAEAQKRTEMRVEELATAMGKLAEAQQRTEMRVEELAEAQKRTEMRVEELATAMGKLAEAQQRTDTRLESFERRFMVQTGALGARWGLSSEEAFRQGMRAILQDVGFTAERFLAMDTTGHVFGRPEQIELDVVVKNGRVLVIELKSSLDKAHVYSFARKVEFYAQHTGRQVSRQLIIAPYVDKRAEEVAAQLGVEICTDIQTLA
ncbi:MAG: DUF3782 domain-containing protein [Deltaproteobacteria bacterium]|nr:DUF3782 domain-containing protein [Deltaproteobacteria bacterium]